MEEEKKEELEKEEENEEIVEEEKEEGPQEEPTEEEVVEEEPTTGEPVISEEETPTNEETITMEEYQEMKHKRNHIIYSLLVIIVALGAYITYSEFLKNKKNDTKPSTTSNEIKEEKKEEPKSNVVETSVEKELIKKLHSLLNADDDDIKNDKFFLVNDPRIPMRPLFENKLSETDKGAITLVRLNGKEVTPKQEDVFQEFSKEDYNKRYKYLFGTEPQNYDIKVESCPSYKFDKTRNAFISYGICGIEEIDANMIYIDAVEVKEGNATIKTYVGGYNHEEPDSDKVDIYAEPLLDYEDSDKYKPIYTKTTFINEDNKNKFSRYNFIFTKAADGNFYFTKIEKAS